LGFRRGRWGDTVESAVVGGVALLMVASTVGDAYGIDPIPRWIAVVLLPVVACVLIWIFGGASVLETLSWTAPLALALAIGYFVLPNPFGNTLIAACLAWAVLMLFWPSAIEAWYRRVLRRK